jgi:hypothetical protein
MDSSQEETFQTIMDYFTVRRYKILFSNPSSLIRAEIGSWMGMSIASGTAKGEVEATVMKRNGGSYLNFNFDFTKEYVGTLIVAVIVIALFIYAVPYWIIGSTFVPNLPSSSIDAFWTWYNTILILLSLFAFAIIMSLDGYYVSRTKKKFIAEFDKFAKSLPKKIEEKNNK